MLRALKVSDFPNMKKEHRQKLHSDLYKRAYPAKLNVEKKAITTEELANILNQG